MVGLSGAASNSALFLDFDGTLIDIAMRPDEVRIPADLPALLELLTYQLDGALAILTGRPIKQLDRFLPPLEPIAAGVHGAEMRRSVGGEIEALSPPLGADVSAAIHRLSAIDSAILIEPKTYSIAVHYRQAPHLAKQVYAALQAILHASPDPLHVTPGRGVFEVMATPVSKGAALQTLMREPCFAGRRPIMIGDDLTDRSAIESAEVLGGRGLKVAGGAFTAAEVDFQTPQQVRDWLAMLAERIAP